MSLKLDNNQLQFSSIQLKDFEENPVWRYFCGEFKHRIELVRNELELGIVRDPKVPDKLGILSMEDIKKRQGECESLRFVLNMPNIVKDLLLSIEEENREKKED